MKLNSNLNLRVLSLSKKRHTMLSLPHGKSQPYPTISGSHKPTPYIRFTSGPPRCGAGLNISILVIIPAQPFRLLYALPDLLQPLGFVQRVNRVLDTVSDLGEEVVGLVLFIPYAVALSLPDGP